MPVKVRLIKAGLSPAEHKDKEPLEETLTSDDIIRSWIDEFKSNKAIKARLDFRRIRGLKKRL
jgi:hypothetical protein